MIWQDIDANGYSHAGVVAAPDRSHSAYLRPGWRDVGALLRRHYRAGRVAFHARQAYPVRRGEKKGAGAVMAFGRTAAHRGHSKWAHFRI